MGLFSRKAKPAASRSAGFTDDALDTLAHLLRAFGDPAFEIEDEPVETFKARCDSTAKHVLVGAPLDGDAGGGSGATGAATNGKNGAAGNSKPSPHERDWKRVRHFFSRRRRAEVKHVDERVGGLKHAIWDLVSGLQTLARGGRQAGTSIDASVAELEQAAESDSVHKLRAAIGSAVSGIKEAVEKQREELEAEMRSLGDRLAALREELLAAKREMVLDPLTQLHNRGAFDEALERYVQLGAFAGQPLTLLMVDLDHFKQVNDDYGHQVGDKVLVAAANCIAVTFPRKNDFAARYGGEEFAVLLHDVDAAQVKPLAERLLDRVRALRIEIGGAAGGSSKDETIDISCSIGAAVLSREDAAEGLVRRADEALYQAKRAGRDRVIVAD